MQERLHAIVHGQVQGVFFRQTTLQTARRLGLTGWARNLRDGTVEVTAEGPRDKLERLLDFLHVGPDAANVTIVNHDWSSARGEFSTFEITF